MLVIEGSDLVGKTNFALRCVEQLVTHGPWIYAHFGKLPDTWRFPWSYKPRMSRFIVQDRFHMSEIFYREARKEPRRLSPFHYKLVDAWLRQLGGFTVVITADPKLISKRFWVEKRDHAGHTEDQILDVNRMFIESRYLEKDRDFFIHCTPQLPFPSNAMVQSILLQYLKRQEEAFDGKVLE